MNFSMEIHIVHKVQVIEVIRISQVITYYVIDFTFISRMFVPVQGFLAGFFCSKFFHSFHIVQGSEVAF